MLNKNLEKALGLEFELDKIKVDLKAVEDNFASDPYNVSKAQESNMSQQDRYIDARLAGIESKLDARMEALQRFQEQAENRFKEAESRFERASDRHSAEVSLLSQKFDARFDETRRHTTMVGIGVFAVIAIISGLSWYWISEQGSYAKSYGETQVDIQRAADERTEFREAVQAIQATQQSILERLPPPSSE